jgi:flagellar basal-body rod modification protein FlgD
MTVTSTTGANVADILNKNAAAASAAASSSSTSGTSSDTTKLNNQYNQFLILLTKQLQNQDPLKPMDTAEFTQQLVQFSSVEQQINQNKRLDQLIGLQTSTNTYAAANFIGNTVAVDSDNVALKSGSASFQYKIEHEGSQALLRIADAQGHVVAIQEANSTLGTYKVDWNGKDASGNQLPDGLYQVSVQYADKAGTTYSAPITAFGVVDSADINNGEVSVNVGSASYPVDKVIKIIKPATTKTAA